MILIKVYDRYEFWKNCAKIMVSEGETMKRMFGFCDFTLHLFFFFKSQPTLKYWGEIDAFFEKTTIFVGLPLPWLKILNYKISK